MIMPIRCPICKDPMLTGYPKDNPKAPERLWKGCCNKIGHEVAFRSLIEDHNVVESFWVQYTRLMRVEWNFSKQTLGVHQDMKKALFLPFFYPDLSDFTKLKGKITTYLLFS